MKFDVIWLEVLQILLSHSCLQKYWISLGEIYQICCMIRSVIGALQKHLSWFQAWNHWKRFQINKKGWKRLRKVFQPAFGCAQNSKAGWNTQHMTAIPKTWFFSFCFKLILLVSLPHLFHRPEVLDDSRKLVGQPPSSLRVGKDLTIYCYNRPLHKLKFTLLKINDNTCHPPAISTVFPIKRILHSISMRSILNIKQDLHSTHPPNPMQKFIA